MSLSDQVRQFLQSHGLRLNTDLGQHFLIDEDVLQAIVDTAQIQPTDTVIEIGPGIGVLTKELLKKTPNVTAIELDARLIPLLKKYLSDSQPTNQLINQLTNQPINPTVLQANALHIDFPVTPYKIVANIPYHITSPLLRHAFLESTPPTSLTLLIQREVAEKICDPDHASLLTILVALFGKPTLVGIVKPSAFLPPPAVDSAVLHIESFEKPLADANTIEAIFTLTKLAFGGKRKMIRNTLGSLPGGKELLEDCGILGERRPDTLDVEEWIDLARKYMNKKIEQQQKSPETVAAIPQSPRSGRSTT